MAVLPINLLIAVCLCGISSLCYGETEERSTCSNGAVIEVTAYARPTNNEVDCRRHSHGEGATYIWTRLDASRRFFVSFRNNVNLSYSGSKLRFNYSSDIDQFLCHIRPTDNREHGIDPLEYTFIPSVFTHLNPQEPPKDVPVQRSEPTTLKCPIKYRYEGERLRIMWYRFRQRIQSPVTDTNHIYIDPIGSLHFSPVRRPDVHDGDKFQCVVADSWLGVRVEGPNITLHVLRKDPNHVIRTPMLSYKTRNFQVVERTNVTLECVFSNNDESSLEYVWYQPDGRAVGTGPYSASKLGQRLFLFDIQRNHTGYWYCGADNTRDWSFRQGIYVMVVQAKCPNFI